MFWIAIGCLVAMFIIYGIYDSIKAKKYKEQSEQNKDFADQIVNQSSSYETEKRIKALMDSKGTVKSLVEAGVLLLFSSASEPKIAITKKCGISSCFTIGENSQYIHPENLILSIKKFEFNNSVTVTKNASTTGRAIVGGLIAGEVGAVIGAASAVSANAAGGVQKTYGGKAEGYRLIMHRSEFRYVVINKSICSDMAVPTYTGFSVYDKGDYYEICGPFVESKTEIEKKSLCQYKDYFTKLIDKAVHQETNELFAEQSFTETCGMCNKQGVTVAKCEINDEMGTRYRLLCKDCIRKYNAKVIKYE